MKNRTGLTACAAAAIIIAGCSESGDAGGNAGAGTTGTAATNSGWDAADACALLDKAAVGAALGDRVTETSLGLVHQASGPEAATSECTYMLESGSRASLMTRNSPISDNTADAIAATKVTTQQTLAAFTDKQIEDVPGIGKAAFFVPRINQLNIFIDDNRSVMLTVGSAPDATAKSTAVEIFKKIKS